ncbi:MAG TPA: TonB-dependent receptor plug domain-containing protein [Opitutaceae bacterium]|nr:TonB-dependent receptor plug domain-containing protein [Opitutaceae bacterium]
MAPGRNHRASARPLGLAGRRRWIALLAAALGLASAAARAAEPLFHIPAGEAEDALRLFSQQAGVELVFSVGKVAGVRTGAVDGRYRPADALRRLVAGTPLLVVQDRETGALAIGRGENLRPAPAPAPAAAAAAWPSAGAGPEGVLKLPQFTVSGNGGSAYHPTDTISAVRIRGDLLDAPISISVVTRPLLTDLGAETMYDATRYLSGVTSGRGTGPGGIMDRQDFRGFESFSRTIDGLSTLNLPGNQGFQANFEPAFVERIEIVKGPDSILSPTGNAGGSMNVITKSPSDEARGELAYEAGDTNAGKVTLDQTGPLPLGRPGEFAYRVIADYQDGQTFVPGGLRQQDLSLQLRWRISDDARLTLKYFGQQWQLTGAAANPNDEGWYVTDPGAVGGATIAAVPPASSGFSYAGWNGDTSWSSRYDRVNLLTGELTAALLGRVSTRLAASIAWDNFDQDAGYPSAVPAESWDPATGRENGVAANFLPSAVPEIANHVRSFNRDIQVQNDYAMHFHPGAVSLEPVAGWTFQRGDNPSYLDRTAPLPAADLLSPVPYGPPRPPPAAYSLAQHDAAHAWLFQSYAFAKAGFWDDRIYALAGVSGLSTRSGSTDLVAGSAVNLRGNHDSYLAGVVVKPLPTLSLYGLHSTNANLTAGPQLAPLWQTGSMDELGLKAEFLERRLAFTAARFEIVQANLASPNPLFNLAPSSNPSIILTDEHNRGGELELAGDVGAGFSVVASHTELRLRDDFGRRLRNVPDSASALLLRYAPPALRAHEAAVFGGLIRTGDEAGETVTGFTPLGVPEQPGYYLPAWTVVNAGASYRAGRWRFDLEVENLLDARFGWQPAGRNSVSPYPGRTLRLVSRVRF